MMAAILILIALTSCSKENIPDRCINTALFSYKYTSSWKLVRIDTLWPLPIKGQKWSFENVCGKEMEKILSAKKIDTLPCPQPFLTDLIPASEDEQIINEIRIYQY